MYIDIIIRFPFCRFVLVLVLDVIVHLSCVFISPNNCMLDMSVVVVYELLVEWVYQNTKCMLIYGCPTTMNLKTDCILLRSKKSHILML